MALQVSVITTRTPRPWVTPKPSVCWAGTADFSQQGPSGTEEQGTLGSQAPRSLAVTALHGGLGGWEPQAGAGRPRRAAWPAAGRGARGRSSPLAWPPRGARLAAAMGPGLRHGSCRSPDLSPEPGASPGSSPPHLGTASVHAGVRVHLPATCGTCVCLRVQTSVNQSYNPVAWRHPLV